MNEYDGPTERFDSWTVILSVIPYVGLLAACGGALFLISHRDESDRTPVSAQARGDLIVACMSHTVYAFALISWWWYL